MRGSTFVVCFHCGLTCWKLRKCQYLITVWNTWINYSCAAFEPRAPCVYFTYACYITNAWSFQRKCIENKWYGEWCGYDKLTVERNIQRATGKRITLLFRLGLQLASPSSFHWSPPPFPPLCPCQRKEETSPWWEHLWSHGGASASPPFFHPSSSLSTRLGSCQEFWGLAPWSRPTTSPGSFIHRPDASGRRLGPPGGHRRHPKSSLNQVAATSSPSHPVNQSWLFL